MVVMKPLPQSDRAIVLRTSCSDAAAWDAIRLAIETPVDGFFAYVNFVDDTEYEGITKEQVLELFRQCSGDTFVIVADDASMAGEHPLRVIDLVTEPGREFRAVPSAVQAIENNLSISNMDFAEFAESVDADGVFRQFPSPGR